MTSKPLGFFAGLAVGPWGAKHLLLALGVWLLAPLLPTWAAHLWAQHQGHADWGAVLAQHGAAFEILKFAGFVALPLLAMTLAGGAGRVSRSDWGLQPPAWDKVAVAVALGLSGYWLATLAFEHWVAGAKEASQQVGRSLGTAQSVAQDLTVVLMVAVAAPLGEEFLFRGVLFRVVRDGLLNTAGIWRRWPNGVLAVAVIASAYAFMTSHGGDGQDLQLGMIGLMGVAAALAYAWTGSLHAPILIHALNNAWALHHINPPWVQPLWAQGLLLLCPLLALALSLGLAAVLPPQRPQPQAV